MGMIRGIIRVLTYQQIILWIEATDGNKKLQNGLKDTHIEYL